jgi:hypothetical protein
VPEHVPGVYEVEDEAPEAAEEEADGAALE